MHLFKPLFFATLWLLCHFTTKAGALKANFTNVQCVSTDEAFASFKCCYLKAIARDKVALYMHLELHQLPVTKITVNDGLYQRGNGYRPLLYNDTIDFCVFKMRTSRLMFWKIIYDGIQTRTNVNHSCPYNHDFILDGLILNDDSIKLLPFPPNVYQLRYKWLVTNSSYVEVRYAIEFYN